MANSGLGLSRGQFLIRRDTTYTIGSGESFPTLAAALEFLADKFIGSGATITLSLESGTHTMAAAIELNPHSGYQIEIVGADPINTTFSSVQSVTGSAGNWAVTLNVASVAGISVGMGLILRSVVPGVEPPGDHDSRPAAGALQMQFFTSGELTTVGTTATLSDDEFSGFAENTDLLLVGGAVREISARSDTGFTISSAFPRDIEGLQYWYTMRATTGTITIVGTAVTGSGTSFLSSVNAGDLITASDGGVRRVASVTNNTAMVLEDDGMDMPAGTEWGVITRGEVYEGCSIITAVDTLNNRITFTSYSRSAYAPPIKNVSFGAVKVLPTALSFSTASGFKVNGNNYLLNNVAIVGGNGTSNVGLDLRGSDGNRASHLALGASVAVIGFDYGVWVPMGSSLYGTAINVAGQYTRGIYVSEGGLCNVTSAVISGSAGYGLYLAPGASARGSDLLVTGCASFGIRGDVGASIWYDFGVSSWNISDNFRMTGAMLAHVVGSRLIGSDSGSGLTGENGGSGRASGVLVLCNGAHGLNLTKSLLEANYAIAMGNGSAGVLAANCPDLSLLQSGIGYNGVNGLTLTRMSQVRCEDSNFIGNPTQIRAVDKSEVHADECGFQGGTTDCNATDRSEIYIPSYESTADLVTTPALNTADTSGALVTDGTRSAVTVGTSVPAIAIENYGGCAFNGSTYFDNNPLTGITDTKKFSLVMKVRFANAASATEYLFNNTGNAIDLIRTTDGDFRVRAEEPAGDGGDIILQQESSSAPASAAGEHVLMISVDLASAGSFQFYLDDYPLPMSAASPIFTNATIGFNVAEYSVGANVAGSLPFTGDIYFLWFDETQNLDFSDESVRRKFVDASGYTVPMGASGELPTGTAPRLFLAYDRGSKWAANKGTGTGTFTATGSPATPGVASYGHLGGMRLRAKHVTVTANYAVSVVDTHVTVNNAGAATTLTLPTPGTYNGGLFVRTIQARAVDSAGSNVVPIAGGSAGTSMLTASDGAWGQFVDDGTNYQIMSGVNTA